MRGKAIDWVWRNWFTDSYCKKNPYLINIETNALYRKGKTLFIMGTAIREKYYEYDELLITSQMYVVHTTLTFDEIKKNYRAATQDEVDIILAKRALYRE